MTRREASAPAQEVWRQIELAILGKPTNNVAVRDGVVGIIDLALATARQEERLKFSGKPCRHTTEAECKTDRKDLHAWQTEQSEWFDATILEIVSEYAQWRDRHDAAFRKKVSDAMRVVSRSYGDIDEFRNSVGAFRFGDFIIDDGDAPINNGLYAYKGKIYRVTGYSVDHLIQFEDEWHPTVDYVCEPDVGKSFSRALPDFRAKFEFHGIRGRLA
jgi:hypothetical protein